jgi:hypothetical protein
VWESAIDGQRLRFRLVGINNQNFLMQDAQTGSWWQQVNGRAIAGPLKGKQLTLVPHDEVAFGTWKTDHPSGRVLEPDPTVEARDDYASLDWERRMARTRVVTELPKGSPFGPRTLVVGVSLNGRSKAYPLDALRQSRVLLDTLGGVPLMVAVAEDGRSVRVFDRRVDNGAGATPEESRATNDTVPHVLSRPGSSAPNSSPVSGVVPGSRSAGYEFVATPSDRLTLTDLETMSEWDFSGRATSGPLAGRTLARIPFLLEYWFDWQTYQPSTDAYKPWRPVERTRDRLDIPKPQ